jgi:hypothetical protein
MKAEKLEFYHIARTDEGQQLLDSSKNLIWDNSRTNTSIRDVLSFKSTLNIGENYDRGLINGLAMILEIDKQSKWQSDPDHFIPFVDHILMALVKSNRRYMEWVLEKMRSEKYSNLPSRFNCIFLSQKEDIEKWYPAISDNFKNTPPIYRLSINGEIHYADQGFIDTDIFEHSVYEEWAEKYWKGEKMQADSTLEILFQGEIEVVEKFSTLEDFKNK